MYPTIQEQEGMPLMSWQIAFAPHGEGTHGFFATAGCSGSGAKIIFVVAKVVAKNKCCCLTWNRIASSKWIAGKTVIAAAYRAVIDNVAFGIQTASTWAGVSTFLTDTSPVQRALCTDHTFRSTSRRTTRVIGQARTYCLFIYHPALTIRTTRRRKTRVPCFYWCG